MQDTQSDLDISRRLGIDEQHINFRPSPNFKNMKKFLKCRIDYSESSSNSPPNSHSEQSTPNPALDSPPKNNPKMERQSPVREIFQPPLPLEPPPPDSPPIIPVPLKLEVIDEEYAENGQGSPNLGTTETEGTSQRLSFERNSEEPDSTSTERPKLTICRDFIRGTCTRAGTCKYAHQFDLSQLSGVYTFCRNYQNAVCTFPQCKYVHATVFEEQEFYRTGILPPHALNHIKRPFYMLPPPPPPPPPPEEAHLEVPRHMSVISPRRTNSADKPLISCVPVSKLESKPAENDFRNMLQAITSPLKRKWSENAFSNPPCDLDNKETFAKKCKNCDTMEIRLQINKEKVESMTRSAEDLKTKTALLNRKTNSLFTVLFTVLKSQAASVGGMNGLISTFNMCGEKEKALLQHIVETHRGPFNNPM